MPNIFGANIAALINKELGSLVFDQVLVKVISSRDPNDKTKRTQTKKNYPCKGFIDDYKDAWINGTTSRISDRKIIIFGASLPAGIIPEATDLILAEDQTFTIVQDGVVRDPAGATYECQSN